MASAPPDNTEPSQPELHFLYQRDIATLGTNIAYARTFLSFQYSKLPNKDSIRLLHLYPCSNGNSYLKGHLSIHKLDRQCEYEAISYSWGDYPKFTQPIFLNGRVLKITDNLFSALTAYRCRYRTRVLWVDAICINQADSTEKGHQVAVMADIFSKAKTVRVWLGPGSAWATEAIKFLKDLALRAESFGVDATKNNQPRLRPSFPSLSISNDEAENLISDAIAAHADSLLLRSWFNRVWVVQEASLAAQLVVSCGLSSISWDIFSTAVEMIRGAYRQIPLGDERLKIEGVKSAWGIVIYRNNFRLLDEPCNRNHHVMTCLAGVPMSNRACSDDRDRVYAMLALTTSPHAMAPDYTKTVAEAYTEFAARYSPNTQIYAAGLCRRQNHPYKSNDMTATLHEPPVIDISDPDYLPSWVPEFRPPRNLAWASPFTGDYSTGTRAPYFFLSHPERCTVMHVSGTIFDIVSRATRRYNDKGKAAHLALDPGFFLSVVDELQGVASNTNAASEPSPESLWLLLAKVLTGGVGECHRAGDLFTRYAHFASLSNLGIGSLAWLTAICTRFIKHSLSPTGEVFQHILLETLGGKPPPLSADGMVAMGLLVYMANILETNRLFRTTRGYLGLAATDLRPGDFVAVFNGCDMPYVVRAAGEVKYKDSEGGKEETKKKKGKKKKKEKKKGSGKDGMDLFKTGAVQIIGPCYLQGIMRGEIFAGRDTPEFSHLRWTRYGGDPVDSLEGGLALI